ncbi:1-phosphatidylinositol 4-5-bisphosphate phosphodiesterase epsilon-1-like isoform X1 [Brachionus plicatilis]|uniref:Phosphoinositide phospholipase C n=1 Tax=Brachionus plicatilis TaxID=10195 RepID=A0A3M7SY32_BRAPC|nr:1-phosphatidylinositol 4-5-bisphosphate phosphodiesterase epsilon-1-like isoform X1 [Brachionus plicatilis]
MHIRTDIRISSFSNENKVPEIQNLSKLYNYKASHLKNGFKRNHTETQLIRCYPNARRFDSSNFSPLNFWSCGMQLIALNYQTIDNFQILNQTLFEQNSNSGYVLKPEVLWNKCHPEYGRFNPFEKKKDANYLSFTIRLISGQYLIESNNKNAINSSSISSSANLSINLSNTQNLITNSNLTYPNNGSNILGQNGTSNITNLNNQRNTGIELLHSTSTFVEIEIIGIPCDCSKEKTKIVNRNAMNPIWNEEFIFHNQKSKNGIFPSEYMHHIVFPDLAFIKFTVIENNGNHIISQRVIPIKHFKQGYRHLKLRNTQNQPLEMSTLFIHSRQKIENIDKVNKLQTDLNSSCALLPSSNEINSSSLLLASTKSKHKQFKLLIYGLNKLDEDDSGIAVKVTQDTTVFQVIEQALAKVDKNAAAIFKERKNYILVQQSDRKWSNILNQAANLDGAVSKSIIPFKQKHLNSYRHLRTKSLCVFYNTTGLLNSNKTIEKKVESKKLSVFDYKNSLNQTKSNKDINILQFDEKIMEAQNKLSGTQRFIIREKSTFVVRYISSVTMPQMIKSQLSDMLIKSFRRSFISININCFSTLIIKYFCTLLFHFFSKNNF